MHLREPADLSARFPDLDGVERSVVELLRAQGHVYMQLLERLLKIGISPADPEVEATGLFRIGEIVTSYEGQRCSSERLCSFLSRMRALAPKAELRNLAGVHPLSRVLWSPTLDTSVLLWVLGEIDDLAELDAQQPILEVSSYPHDHAVYVKLCLLLERGANADWRDTPGPDELGDGLEVREPRGALAWMLRDKPIPLHLLHLFIEHGATDENFLLDLVTSKDRKLAPQMPGLVRAYLRRPSNRDDVDRSLANGLTPLHIALVRGEPALVSALVEGGASPTLKTTSRATLRKVKVAKGTTAQTLAAQLGDPSLLAALKGETEGSAPVSDLDRLARELSGGEALVSRFDAMLARFDGLPGLRWSSRPQAIGADASSGVPLTPSVLATIDALWPRRTPAHLALLRIGILLGGRAVSWSIDGGEGDSAKTIAMGGFELAPWGEMIASGLLCRHEDTGRTYFQITKTGVKLRFIATYERSKAFNLDLDPDTFVQRLLDLGGLHYFTYFSFPKRAPYIARLPDFDASLEAIGRAGLKL